MKKVLFVADTLQFGGAEKVLLTLLKNIDKKKYDVTALALVNYGVLINEIKKIEGIKYIGGLNGIFGKTELKPTSITYKIENKMELKIKRLKARIEKMQEMFNKDLEEIKKSQYSE